MPVFEYLCPDGHKFEELSALASKAPVKLPCPVCGKQADKVLSSYTAIVH